MILCLIANSICNFKDLLDQKKNLIRLLLIIICTYIKKTKFFRYKSIYNFLREFYNCLNLKMGDFNRQMYVKLTIIVLKLV